MYVIFTPILILHKAVVCVGGLVLHINYVYRILYKVASMFVTLPTYRVKRTACVAVCM